MERNHGPAAPGDCQFRRKTDTGDGPGLLESTADDGFRTGGALASRINKRPVSSMVHPDAGMAENNHLCHSRIHHIPGGISRYTAVHIFPVLMILYFIETCLINPSIAYIYI